MKIKKLKVCPKCFSPHIVYAGSSAASGFLGDVVGQRYHCKDCDFLSSVILEVTPDELVRLKKEKLLVKGHKA